MTTACTKDNYLGWTALLTVALQLFCFFIAYACQIDLLTDLAGSLNFILIALFTFFAGGHYYPRQIAATCLVLIARFYLGGYLFSRVIKRGHDARFNEIRSQFVSFLMFWVFQMIWAWGVSLPLMFINCNAENPEMGGADIAGIIIFIVGLLCEIVGDLQKDAFRSDAKNKHDFMHTGIWKYSRHPNFFGEIFLWWGLFIMCTPVFDAAKTWGYATIASPILTMIILLFFSGVPTAEGDNQRRFLTTPEIKARFLAYRESTSPIIPMPPALYKPLPMFIKRVFFFEYPMYETDWNYVGSGNDAPLAPHSN